MVRQQGPWDPKPEIARLFKYSQEIGGEWYYYDIWGNIMFGYLGAASGFSESALLDGAGIEQIGSSTGYAIRYQDLDYSPKRQTGISGLPPDYPLPQLTATWPPENVALLEHYRQWLLSGGASPKEVYHLYIPMAGHALGLNLKPHPQLDLDADLERALDYVKAKGSSAEWTDMCRLALEKFRRFLRIQRGEPEPDRSTASVARYQVGLPDWLVEAITHYQHVSQRNWRPARLAAQSAVSGAATSGSGAGWASVTPSRRWLT